jgi:hypothetical protein
MKYTSPETKSILQALRNLFGPPAFGLLTEVADGTGTARIGRFADALAMSLWPSRGLHLHGIEIKASRTDWLRELKNPAKADAIAQFCDFWWVATLPDIVKDGELPPTWGLFELEGDKLKEKIKAPLAAPIPVDRSFLAAVFRRSVEQRAEAAELEIAREEGRKEARNHCRWELEEAARLRDKVKEFERTSGLEIELGWQLGKLGKIVKLLDDGLVSHRVMKLREMAQSIVESIDGSELAKTLAEQPEPPLEESNGRKKRRLTSVK